jgi:hypothetical protein
MKYAIDQIIDNIAILENIETKEKLEVDTNLLPKNIKEKNILVEKNGKYFKDKKEEEARLKRIEEKLKRLQNLD